MLSEQVRLSAYSQQSFFFFVYQIKQIVPIYHNIILISVQKGKYTCIIRSAYINCFNTSLFACICSFFLLLSMEKYEEIALGWEGERRRARGRGRGSVNWRIRRRAMRLCVNIAEHANKCDVKDNNNKKTPWCTEESEFHAIFLVASRRIVMWCGPYGNYVFLSVHPPRIWQRSVLMCCLR